ncbi:oxygen-insensitive NADPH nitroreductase [Anoxynatronum buryatiense]|uniref:Nitroreductase n=1 Tax=Anoxynatronum buryatiense TaxID=489973 RepID=A0AA45WYD8_9CLOT|nr:oxygen-insensitive NADPH nitroreductase [Anoxynatronum buryatiense]SMP67807.1 nitroreductase [Anoxynatronum buryatiense]
MNEVIHLLENHRSIRKFLDQPVEDAVVEKIISCGQHAATSSFLQAYSVIRVRDAEKREQLATWCGDQMHVKEAPLFLIFCADLHRWQMACEVQGVKMVPGMTEQFIIASVDAGIFGQNVLVAAESLGLGGVYVGGIRNHPREVSDLLQLPKQVYPVFGMSLGYPAQDPQVKPRLPLPLVLMEETYHEDGELLKEYDHTFQAYLNSRGSNQRNQTWTQTVAEKVTREMRPHMRRYLTDQGFELK